MRLTLVIEHFHPAGGGAEGVAVAVVRELARRGHAVQVVAADGKPLDGVPLHLAPRGRQAAAVQALGDAAGLVVDWGLSLPAGVHRLGGGVTRAFRRYNRLAKPPALRWLARLHDWTSLRLRREIALETRLLRRPEAALLAVSHFVENQVLESVPSAAPRVTVIHNGVDTARFSPARREPCRADVRRELGIPEQAVVFLMLAHNPRLKNVELPLRLFTTLHRRFPDARLVIAGKHGSGGGAVPPWLVAPGHWTQPERLYAAADALLHPTFYDACANVVLEGLASGLPVVSSTFNGSAELITSGRNGFVLPVAGQSGPELRSAWWEILQWLAADGELRRRLGEEGRKLAEANSLDRYFDRLERYLLERAGAAAAE